MSIAIDARLTDGVPGGVQQWVVGLAAALSALEGDEEYGFLGDPREQSWLLPFLAGGAKLLDPPPRGGGPIGRRLSSAATRSLRRRAPWLRPAWQWVRRRAPMGSPIVSSEGVIEAAGADLVHFPFQTAFTTDLPSIYQPWDMQHVHLPEFFTASERSRRDVTYRTHSERAALVVVASAWTKTDVSKHFGIAPSKIAVVGVPPPTEAYADATAADIATVRAAYSLPARFALYPAQTWPHKNHVRLLEAIAMLRDRSGVRIDLVCTGAKNFHWPEIQRALQRLRVGDQVRFLGYVPPTTMRALYAEARLLVFPSLFEGWGIPVVEAMTSGVPVACSNVTSLPDLVGDAGLLFNPLDVDAIASSIERLWHEEPLRAEVVERGRREVARLDWGETARTLRAHYRHVAGRTLSAEDRYRVQSSLGTQGG